MTPKQVAIESFDVRPSVLKLEDGAEITVYPSVIEAVRSADKDGQPIYNFASSLQFRLTKPPADAEPKPTPTLLHSEAKH